LDKKLTQNTLTMYAENLGSIPPNTSLLLIHDGEERKQVNITSNKYKNGTVVFTLKKNSNL
jgi:hypothetical protein